MSLNSTAHFATVPGIDMPRSKFDRSKSHKFTGNVGDLIPVYCDPDIMPGDTVTMDTSKVIRFQTMLTPVMDNLYADFYWFFVPHRLVWDHWINFMGENVSSNPWIPNVEYTVPKLVIDDPSAVPDTTSGENFNKTGTLLDYLGFPVGMPLDGIGPGGSVVSNPQVKINALPFRAYAKICQDWFRSESLTQAINIYTGDSDQRARGAIAGANYINDVPKGGAPFKAAKFFDKFTSCLPGPQKGPAVTLSTAGMAKVLTGSNFTPNSTPAHWSNGTTGGTDLLLVKNPNADSSGRYDAEWDTVSGLTGFKPINLYADLSTATAISVTDLRMAFQVQKFYERAARSGSRYIETIKAFFNVDSPDARLQRPEYLGGSRVPIVIDQVTNTSQSATDPLGDVGAFSRTVDYHSDFTHSFTEHGTLMCCMVLRTEKSYCTGMPKWMMRDSKFDFYWPVFDSISEQPVYKDEICISGSTVVSTGERAVFGYNEAWCDYRYADNTVAGEMRPYVTNNLGSWTFADDYNTAPSLSDSWIREDKANVDRTLAVTSAVSNQFWCDMYFNCAYTRPMGLYSVPGLIDHH